MRPILALPFLTAALLAVAPAPALAAKPTVERIPVQETFPDPFLTQACGVAVMTTARGHLTVRTFERQAGLVRLLTINVHLTARADGNVYRFRDVGSDAERVTRDGRAILRISGQVPFSFKGTLKVDLSTGEAIMEPQRSTEDELAEACAVLDPA